MFRPLMLLLLILIALCTCQVENKDDPYAHISDNMVTQVLRKSIEHHGGLDNWNKINTLTYRKDFELYTESGQMEKSLQQWHNYAYAENAFYIITKDSLHKTTTIKVNDTIEKIIDEQKVEEDQTKLSKQMNTSLYVVSMPFKLLDPGVRLSYEGEETIETKQRCHVIKAEYNSQENENHSTDDTWWYYFDMETGRVLANKVKTHDHWSLIENLTFVQEGDILYNGKRTSYRIDSTGQKLYRRASYDYYDYKSDHRSEQPSRRVETNEVDHFATLDTNETITLYNDSLSVELKYSSKHFPDKVWLYVLSEEIGESRKIMNIRKDDTLQVTPYKIIIKDKYYKPSSAFQSVDIAITKYNE